MRDRVRFGRRGRRLWQMRLLCSSCTFRPVICLLHLACSIPGTITMEACSLRRDPSLTGLMAGSASSGERAASPPVRVLGASVLSPAEEPPFRPRHAPARLWKRGSGAMTMGIVVGKWMDAVTVIAWYPSWLRGLCKVFMHLLPCVTRIRNAILDRSAALSLYFCACLFGYNRLGACCRPDA